MSASQSSFIPRGTRQVVGLPHRRCQYLPEAEVCGAVQTRHFPKPAFSNSRIHAPCHDPAPTQVHLQPEFLRLHFHTRRRAPGPSLCQRDAWQLENEAVRVTQNCHHQMASPLRAVRGWDRGRRSNEQGSGPAGKQPTPGTPRITPRHFTSFFLLLIVLG